MSSRGSRDARTRFAQLSAGAVLVVIALEYGLTSASAAASALDAPTLASARAWEFERHTAVPQSEGDGARVRRCVGGSFRDYLNPLLLFDHFQVRPPAAFPPHPHRGQCLVTYMLTGGFEHRDSRGNVGTVLTGGVQFMNAARGIVHSETPAVAGMSNDGIQLWINLAAERKRDAPVYGKYVSKQFPELALGDGIHVRLVLGTLYAEGELHTSPLESVLAEAGFKHVSFFDVSLDRGRAFDFRVPVESHALAYVLRGSVTTLKPQEGTLSGEVDSFGARAEAHDCLFFDSSPEWKSQHPTVPCSMEPENDHNAGEVPSCRTITFANPEAEAARILLFTAAPLDEPMLRYGPFVYTHKLELGQWIREY
eukprot:CAMPEP_0185843204 /NCGR_PEP_ID=MMETSP1353-20130828/18794_1 /TAXON_ID=1077150 /ORGANISM="Erythrolobus australicus, Strain CCMP3124" /LENGTH=366 /DNA_ID=CAMNT_0028542715 /DNA_START=46 /DNA_END=1143 /DNA_ORIENTATION=-